MIEMSSPHTGLDIYCSDYIDNIPCFAVNGVFNFEVVVSNLWRCFLYTAWYKGFTNQAVIVTFSD